MTTFERPEVAVAACPPASPLSVLLVDDDENEVYLVRTLLESEGRDIRLTWAATCATAFDKLRQRHFDAVLLDLNLTDSFGPSTFYRFRHEAGDVPIVVLTGIDNRGMAAALVRDGAEDCLLKCETTAESLTAAIRLAVEHHQSHPALDGASAAASANPGRVLGFVGAKGGVGTTTVALNIAAALASHGKVAIAIELRADPGSFSIELGVTPARNLSTLLALPAHEITAGAVASHLIEWPNGLKALCAPQGPAGITPASPECVRAIIAAAAQLGDYVVLDLPQYVHCHEAFRAALAQCDFLTLVTDCAAHSVERAIVGRASLLAAGVREEDLGALVMERHPPGARLPLAEVRASLPCPIVGVLPPLPENWRGGHLPVPFAVCDPDSVAAAMIKDAAVRISAPRPVPRWIC